MHKWWLALTGTGLLTVMLWVLALGQGVPGVAGPAPGRAPATYQLLTNPGLEAYDPPYGQFEGVDCQVATGWQRFWYGGPEPYWMDDRVFAYSHLGVGRLERIEGDTSQLIVGVEPYTAGLWQQVGGLTPGVGYGFHAALLTIYQTSAPPAVDGMMIKQVGLDPTGGTDPQAAAIVWSEADAHDEGPWAVDLRAAAYAQSPTVTVFIRIISPYPAGPWPFLNISFLDSAILAQTPVVTATSPAVSPVPTFTVSWDNAVAAPGGEVKRYDVQWLDEAEGVWRDWFVRTRNVQGVFVGKWGHAYRFRARAFQRYENGAHLYSPYRPEGDTRTFVQGARLFGRVLSHDGKPLEGATVAISGTAYAATSHARGSYLLDTPPMAGPQTVTADHPAWLPPAPLYGVSLGPQETTAFTWTLRPLDDAVLNGGFEAGLEGWSSGGDVAVVAGPVHTGRGALALGAPGSAAPLSQAAGVSQTVAVTGAWEPALSFWYAPATAGAAEPLQVVLTVVTQTVSPTLPVTATWRYTLALAAEGWHHRWYAVGPPQAELTATVTVHFQAGAAVYLDEVSLGATGGGPYQMCLPLLGRRFESW